MIKRYNYSGYEEYIEAQKRTTEEKIPCGYQWAIRKNIQFIAKMFKGAKFGICHGTRTGSEQLWFSEMLPGCEVWGTEISPLLDIIPKTKIIDFNTEIPEWVGKADFVYSNSFDHSYDPEQTLSVWCRQTKASGRVVLELATNHSDGEPTESDPVRFDSDGLKKILPKGFCLKIIKAPEKKSICKVDRQIYLVVIGREA